ncbi:nucleotide-binding protein [Solirubrobacter phytolaccae]|uniref:Nucleotide-binding protein n=1 Tax=Solirubrobacter phytolaccae TaxID=1404360 RepID=A0A9X3S9P3_9ACTN|nr:nucleotide-binding protein [Solirubrobacter phytolaccae]MDA0181701.1 nucleotide-binding protein [Solirubrobacter phytolaccae]
MFIGSSSQSGLPVADELQALLSPYCRPTIWNQGVFVLSRGTLEALEHAADDYDFAVLVMAADDEITQAGNTMPSVRDNVLFELGLFTGALGSRRTFMVWCRDDPPKIPTDLAGITAATYPAPGRDDLASALGPVALQIRKAMDLAGPRRPLLVGKERTIEALLQRDIRALGKELRINEDDIGVHLWLLDEDARPPVMQRVLRVNSSSAPATASFSSWRQGRGLVGTAWEQDDDVWADLGAAPLAGLSRADFEALPAADQLGMDWEIYERSRRYFRLVYAVPMQDRTFTPVGTLSVNIDRDVTAPQHELVKTVRSAARGMAHTCRLVLDLA